MYAWEKCQAPSTKPNADQPVTADRADTTRKAAPDSGPGLPWPGPERLERTNAVTIRARHRPKRPTTSLSLISRSIESSASGATDR